MDFKSMTKQEWQEHISVLRSYACKLQEPKDYGEKAGIAAYLFADAMANDKFPRYYPSDRVICTLDMRAIREFTVEDNDYEAAETYKWKHQRLEWLFDALEYNITYCVEWNSNNVQISHHIRGPS